MLKPIENYKGYFISDDGVVYCNLGRGNRNKDKTTELYPIKPRATKHGYLRIYVRNVLTNKRTDLYIHRLVGEYFVPNPENKKVINHKNCQRDDNRAENLEWVSVKENVHYAMHLNHLKQDKQSGKFVSGL